MKKRIGLVIFTVSLIGILAVILVNNISADSQLSRNVALDLDQDGRNEEIALSTTDDGKDSISISKSFFSRRTAELSGFEDDIRFCEEPLYDFSGVAYLCLIGEVGAHSQNIQFLRYQKDKIAFLAFKSDGLVATNITSDVPQFIIDRNEESLFVDNRNYELNPVVNAVRAKYNFENEMFTFFGFTDIINDGTVKN